MHKQDQLASSTSVCEKPDTPVDNVCHMSFNCTCTMHTWQLRLSLRRQLQLFVMAAYTCCIQSKFQQALSTCPLNHTVTYNISSMPALFDTVALETAQLLQSSAGHQVKLAFTFDSLLVNHLHEEALLVHIPAVDPVLGCAFVQQAVHKCCMRLSVAVDPGDGLQACHHTH